MLKKEWVKNIKTQNINIMLKIQTRLNGHQQKAKKLTLKYETFKKFEGAYGLSDDDNDDNELLARSTLFGANATISFNFNRRRISDSESVIDLIKKYREIGAPMRGQTEKKEFVDYYNQNYEGKASRGDWYPTLDLIIDLEEYGKMYIGFSVSSLNGGYKLIGWGDLTGLKPYFMEFIRHSDLKKKNINETIESLNLKITNPEVLDVINE